MPILPVQLDERKMFEGGITENLQREDISPISKARALKTYIEKFQASQRECGILFGLSQGAVSNLMRLLSLPDEIVKITDQGHLAERQARSLMGLPAEVATEIVRRAIKLDELPRSRYIERRVSEVKSVGMQAARDAPLRRPKDDHLLSPEACPCCYKTPKSYVREGQHWRCGRCQAAVQISVLTVSKTSLAISATA